MSNKGEVGILNVGAGDIKLSFDKSNPGERARAARVIKDMLRRGYVIGVEVPGKPGEYERARDFDEASCQYIIWDFDSAAARLADQAEALSEKIGEEAAAATAPAGGETQPAPRRGGRKTGTKRIPAESTRTVAVGRSAGG